jgi:hypothetical protein
MPKFDRALAGGKAISGGALAPRSRRGNTNQTADYWFGGVLADTGAYESIATTTITADTASVTFSSIPQTFKHLQLRMFAKTDRADTDDVTLMQFNGDTAANYSWHWLRGNGTAPAGSAAGASQSYIYLNYACSGNSSASNVFGACVLDIPDYANTNKYKTTRSLHGYDLNGQGWIYLASGNWRSTSAITSIVLDQQYGTNWKQYSSFALYGIKG